MDKYINNIDSVISIINNVLREDVPELLNGKEVTIKDTGTVFDGKSGIVEQDLKNKLIVLIDFDKIHKVRNTFKRENVSIKGE